jgi:hypothetical protein
MVHKSVWRNESMLAVLATCGVYSWSEPGIQDNDRRVHFVDDCAELFKHLYMILDGPWRDPKLNMLGEGGNTSPTWGGDKAPPFFRNRLSECQTFELVKNNVKARAKDEILSNFRRTAGKEA